MKQEDLLKVIEQQDKKNMKLIKDSMKRVVESEFILSNVMLRYLDFIEKSSHPERYISDINELMKKGGPLTKKLLDFDIGKHMKEQTMYLHKHSYIEIDYVYKGCCTYYIENESSPFQLKEKELCIINQSVVHGLETQGEDNIIIKCMIPFEYIEIEQYLEISQRVEMKKFLSQATSENVTRPFYMIYQIADTQYFEEIIYLLFCELLRKEIGWRSAVKNHLSNLFLYLMRAEDKGLLQAKEVKEENFNIAMVLECIRRNYQFITLKDLARDFYFHENYLSRMIKQHCQVSFRDLLCQIRLKEAENLLINTELSVTEIAERVGYRKPNFFFKLFKEHYKMTPIKYRSKHMQGYKENSPLS